MEHKEYIRRSGMDMPEVADWTWVSVPANVGAHSTDADNT